MVEDSLIIARDKYPGQRNSLDALASRFNIKEYDRTFHGALLDANILADVYLSLTGGQTKFEFLSEDNLLNNSTNQDELNDFYIKNKDSLVQITSSDDEKNAHEQRLLDIEKNNSIETIWRKFWKRKKL